MRSVQEVAPIALNVMKKLQYLFLIMFQILASLSARVELLNTLANAIVICVIPECCSPCTECSGPTTCTACSGQFSILD